MSIEKFALIADSCCDIPPHLAEKYGIYIVPLAINYKDKSYLDGVDIDAEYVYNNFENEIPTTSLPSGDVITEVFDRVYNDGYRKAYIVTISSGLSGTFNMLSLMSSEYSKIEFKIFDTKLIGMGSGIVALTAAEMIKNGISFDDIEAKIKEATDNTHMYFCLSTLEYLIKGGRIGLVSGTVASLLGILPVISCNKDGIYHTVKKARGRVRTLNSAVAKLIEDAKQYTSYKIAVVHGGAKKEADEILSNLKKALPKATEIFEGQICPALVVHTGPGLIGIGLLGNK